MGQHVYYYRPPSGSARDAEGVMRNQQYRGLYAGPAVVTARLSNVGYTVRHLETGRVAYRHRQHLRPFDPTSLAASEDQMRADSDD